MSDTPKNETVGGVTVSADDRRALGALVSTHRTPSGLHAFATVGVGVLAALTGALAVFVVWSVFDGKQSLGTQLAMTFLFLGIAAPFVIGFAYLAAKLFHRLAVFENGFVLKRFGPRVVLWDDVGELYATGINQERWLMIRPYGGRALAVDNFFRGYDRAAAVIRGAATRSFLARAGAALGRGESVPFGSVTATPDGLEHDGKPPLAWTDLSRVSIEWKASGNVVYPVVRIGTDRSGSPEVWVGKQAGKFPNLDAFLLLVHRLTGVVPDAPGN